MTLNDLWARFKVIDSLHASKMIKYGLVMTPTPCRVVGCIISIRPTCAPVHILTYLHRITSVYATGLWSIYSFLTFQRMIKLSSVSLPLVSPTCKITNARYRCASDSTRSVDHCARYKFYWLIDWLTSAFHPKNFNKTYPWMFEVHKHAVNV